MQRQLRQGISIGIFLLASFWLISLILGLVDKAKVAVGEAHEVEQQYTALEKRKATLEANLAALNTERGQEAAIRTTFGVVRPGEEVIVVVPPTATTSTTTTSWWSRLWDWF